MKDDSRGYVPRVRFCCYSAAVRLVRKTPTKQYLSRKIASSSDRNAGSTSFHGKAAYGSAFGKIRSRRSRETVSIDLCCGTWCARREPSLIGRGIRRSPCGKMVPKH